MKHRALPKPGNIYTLNWKEFNDNKELIFDGKCDFCFLKKTANDHVLIKKDTGETYNIPKFFFFKNLVARKTTKENPKNNNICRFIDLTLYGKFRKEYFGLQVKDKFYYVKDNVEYSINVNRDNVKLGEEYDDVPINAHPLLKEKYCKFIHLTLENEGL